MARAVLDTDQRQRDHSSAPPVPERAREDEVRDSVANLWDTVRAVGGGTDLLLDVLEEVRSSLEGRQAHGGGMTEEQAAFLVRSGTMTAQQFEDTEASVARGELSELERRTRLAAVTTSLDTREVAELLGIDASRVRHRKAKDGLYAFPVGSKLRFPSWQFTGDPGQPVLPGLTAVVRAIPDDMRASSVLGFMTTPQEDLLVDDAPVTPPEWLAGGGDPQEVVDLLESHLQS